MPDITVTADQIGAYEFPLTPNTPQVVIFNQPYDYRLGFGWEAMVMVHTSTAPVYAGFHNVIVKDPTSGVVPTGTWLNLPMPNMGETKLTLISAGTATVSVARTSKEDEGD